MILNSNYNVVSYNSNETFIIVKPTKYKNSNIIFNNLNLFANDCTALTSGIINNRTNYDFMSTMYMAFDNCYNMTSEPVCGTNVVNMQSAYYCCYNLTGNPVCGSNVRELRSTYHTCYNLTGNPVCGTNVVNMQFAYSNCNNLKGSPDKIESIHACTPPPQQRYMTAKFSIQV